MTGRRKGLRITCYGDSLIQGFPFTEEHSWVAAAGRGHVGKSRDLRGVLRRHNGTGFAAALGRRPPFAL